MVGKFLYLETLSAVKKAIKAGSVIVNGTEANTGHWVQAGDQIQFSMACHQSSGEADIDVLYEDDHILIVNKPPGILSSGMRGESLQSLLMNYDKSGVEDALAFPYLIHRLDKATCGVMIAARSMQARRRLGEMIESRLIDKQYSAIVEGIVPSQLIWITDDIDGQSAKTEILSTASLKTHDPTTMVRVRLHTGRTHQIRRHFVMHGHPIVGDPIHNAGGLSFGYGLFLMADRVEFVHPITSRVVLVIAPMHKKFKRYSKR